MAMDSRPILLAMCNPRSSDPDLALWPDPPGCSGHRLWQLLHGRTGATQEDYCRTFDRRNLLRGRWWSPGVAREFAPRFIAGVTGREVLVLGGEVRDALGLPRLLVHPQELHGVTWRQLPHPSGRCRWYNDEDNRLTAALLLESLYTARRAA